jgi:hypothetical protein
MLTIGETIHVAVVCFIAGAATVFVLMNMG